MKPIHMTTKEAKQYGANLWLSTHKCKECGSLERCFVSGKAECFQCSGQFAEFVKSCKEVLVEHNEKNRVARVIKGRALRGGISVNQIPTVIGGYNTGPR